MVPRDFVPGYRDFFYGKGEIQMQSSTIRQLFLDYFKSKDHMVEPGASLVPHNDPTLLWINSGVAALKKYFDGSAKPANPKIVNVQKSIRTNDIENVGKTARHHTFFEMLGNFSIGAYFKEEAIAYGWEFLTSKEWMGFDKDKLYVSVHPSDDQAYDIWVNQIKIDPQKILKSEDNFWQIGDGPCGPNSEIFYDRGVKYDPDGVGEKLFFDEIENDRYVEVWNIVFSQYNGIEGEDRSSYKELPQKNIDTGMGFERLCCVAQQVDTNYDTDLFMPIIKAIATKTKKAYEQNTMAYRVIADHIRTVVFALSDGALFSNEGRGYVLRRLLRRAVRYGIKLDIEKLFLKDLVNVVVDVMGEFYTDLKQNQSLIENLIEAEEKRFKNTLNDGEMLLKNRLKEIKGNKLDGVSAFTLYDTYGFPLELTQEICEENDIEVDVDGFHQQMKLQQERARNARVDSESMSNQSEDLLKFTTESEFVGYDQLHIESEIIGLFANNQQVETLTGVGFIITKQTPFYAESGGQIADSGYVVVNNQQIDVIDVVKAVHKQHMHKVDVTMPISVGDAITLAVDYDKREKIKANHTLAHLLQAALQKTLGDHVHQAGSYVGDEYMRFDFTHFQKVEQTQLKEIEAWMNKQIFAGLPVSFQTMDLEKAKQQGAMALFNEKYEAKVRVVTVGGVSMELCGGTHVDNTQAIGVAKLVSEESIGSGIRRIVCVSKEHAYQQFTFHVAQLEHISKTLSVASLVNIQEKVDQLKDNYDSLRKDYAQLEQKINQQQATALMANVEKINDVSILIKKIENQPLKSIKSMVESGISKLDKGLIVLGAVENDKVMFVAGCTKNLLDQNIDCSSIVKEAAMFTGGNGGGRKDFAQAGGKDVSKVDDALDLVKKKVLEIL